MAAQGKPHQMDSRESAVAARIRKHIKDGVYPPGRYLPTAEALAKEYGYSEGTVHQALKSLRDEGLITKDGLGRGLVPHDPGELASESGRDRYRRLAVDAYIRAWSDAGRLDDLGPDEESRRKRAEDLLWGTMTPEEIRASGQVGK